MKISMLFSLILLGLTIVTQNTFAAGGGGHAVGGSIAFPSPSQDDLNTMITNANTAGGGISTPRLGTAYEFSIYYMYRISGSMFALMFRPSYFMQNATGGTASADYNYKLSGYTVFPMLRLYPLENNFLKFFMQTGVGYGRISADVTEGSFNAKFAGGAFGAILGLGAEFCFGDHCVTVEGNGRYLPIERNLVTGSTGTPAATSMSQYQMDKEAEFDNQDLKTTLTGFSGILAYTYRF